MSLVRREVPGEGANCGALNCGPGRDDTQGVVILPDDSNSIISPKGLNPRTIITKMADKVKT